METERRPNRTAIRALGAGLIVLGLIFFAAQALRFGPRIIHQRTVRVERPAAVTVSLPEMPEMPEMPAMPDLPEMPDMPAMPDMPEIAAPSAIEVRVGSGFDSQGGTFVANTVQRPSVGTIVSAAMGGFAGGVLLTAGAFLVIRSLQRKATPPTGGPAADRPAAL